MTTATLTSTDIHLRHAVMRQLDWDPEVDSSAIGITAQDGVVTLTGWIGSYAGKLAAERVAKRVRGVRAVANDIIVRPMVERTDAEVARDVAQVLDLQAGLASVQATVHHGRVTLSGSVEWLYQKQLAEGAVRHVRGVLGLRNYVTVKPRAVERDVHRRILRTLHNNADLDARLIRVAVNGDTVTLTGTVGSLIQRDAAERAAGSAPGITYVENKIRVEPPEPREPEPIDEIC